MFKERRKEMERTASSFTILLALVRYLQSTLESEKSIAPAEIKLLERGFALAWFIHQDREKAEEIAAGAFARHETVVENQTKYIDYTTPRRRTKVQPTQDQYYQHEVLQHSDEWQKKELKRES